MAHELVEAMVGMKEKEVSRIAQQMLDDGQDPHEVLRLTQEAMRIVGDRYEQGSFFLPELIMAGEILKKVAALVKPHLVSQVTVTERLGTVVLGTVRGDIHNIGKDIVGFVLDVNGFEVVDLGIDVREERFVEAVREHQPQVLALSGFLSLAFDSMRSTIAEVEAAGLRDGMAVIIGGGQVDETVRSFTGADAFGDDAMDAVTLVREAVGVA